MSDAGSGPILHGLINAVRTRLRSFQPWTSRAYWQARYLAGDNSGHGSYSILADFKAEVLNVFMLQHRVHSVIELGCGDGNQLSLARYPRYTGYDVSARAVELCRKTFASDDTKEFRLYPSAKTSGQADLTLSLDVIYHLVEDAVFERYMRDLFAMSLGFVIIYSSNMDTPPGASPRHIRHRRFTDWVELREPSWTLTTVIPNRYPYRGDDRTGSHADFYLYARA